MSEPTALSLMNIVADCCAGNSLARITDQAVAYAGLAGLFVDDAVSDNAATASHEELVPLPLRVASAENLPIKKLVEFRKRELAASDGHLIRDLRHKFVGRIEGQVKQLAAAATAGDAAELRRQFEQDTLDDYRDLREALRLEAQQLLGTTELITVVVGVGAMAAAMAGHVVPGS
jgi:hypothetical protein